MELLTLLIEKYEEGNNKRMTLDTVYFTLSINELKIPFLTRIRIFNVVSNLFAVTLNVHGDINPKTTDMKLQNHQLLRDHSPPGNSLFCNLKTICMKSTLMFLTTFLFFQANSQIQKGNWLAGGSGSFYSYNQKYTSQNNSTEGVYTSIDLSASVGYFFFERFAAGLRPGFSYFKGKVDAQGEVGSPTKLLIGPFARYYFLKTDKPFNFLADVSYQIGNNKDVLSPKAKGKLNRFSVMGGTEVFFNSSVGLEVLLGYRKMYESRDHPTIGYSEERKGFFASVGFQIHLENF